MVKVVKISICEKTIHLGLFGKPLPETYSLEVTIWTTLAEALKECRELVQCNCKNIVMDDVNAEKFTWDVLNYAFVVDNRQRKIV